MKWFLGLVAAAVFGFAPEDAAAQRIVTCSSRDNDREFCNVDTRGGVRLVRQLSDSDCVRNRTWGTTNQGIWVSRGCRAQFEVNSGSYDRRDDRYGDRRRDDRYDDRYDDRRDRRGNRARISSRQAGDMCRRAVAREVRGIRAGDIRIVDADYARNGDFLVNWRASRGLNGACRIDDRDRDVRVSVARGWR